jgi:hypothetical protein
MRVMPPTARRGPLRLLVLLAMLQAGCRTEPDDVLEVEVECGPRDLTPECCLKHNPGQWERCTGMSEMARVAEEAPRTATLAQKVTAAGTAATLAAHPLFINSAERRGSELAADLLAKIEKAIVKCVRKADQEVNDYHFQGGKPDRELCQQLKVGERTTWAAYLGLFKHEQAWPCLREALDKLLPDHYRLHPRFRLDERTGEWKFLDEPAVKEIVAQQGWKGLKGTIEPDIVLMDAQRFVMHVYDLKFPCPESNDAKWARYTDGPWKDQYQRDIYKNALGVTPLLVSPREGVQLKPETR